MLEIHLKVLENGKKENVHINSIKYAENMNFNQIFPLQNRLIVSIKGCPHLLSSLWMCWEVSVIWSPRLASEASEAAANPRFGLHPPPPRILPLSSSPVDGCITGFGIRSIRSISQVGDKPRFVLDPSTHKGILLPHTRSAMNCPKPGLYPCGWILTNCYRLQHLKLYIG